jgi:hypothetical protein
MEKERFVRGVTISDHLWGIMRSHLREATSYMEGIEGKTAAPEDFIPSLKLAYRHQVSRELNIVHNVLKLLQLNELVRPRRDGEGNYVLAGKKDHLSVTTEAVKQKGNVTITVFER